MTRIAFIILSSIPILLASCGSMSSENESLESSLPADQRQVPPVSYSAEDVAREFELAGVPAERLERIKQSLLLTKKNMQANKNSRLSAQSAKNILDEVDILVDGLEIAKMKPRNVNSIDGQASLRALMIQATQNIVLGSLSNSEYLARQETNIPTLDCKHNECSIP